MTDHAIKAQKALDLGTDEDIANCAANILHWGSVERDEGVVIGVTYHDSATQRYYNADLDDCRSLLLRVASGEQDAYSFWCADTMAIEYKTQKKAAKELL